MNIDLIHADAHYDPMNAGKWAALADALRDADREREAYAADLCEEAARGGNNPLSPAAQAAIARTIAEVERWGVTA